MRRCSGSTDWGTPSRASRCASSKSATGSRPVCCLVPRSRHKQMRPTRLALGCALLLGGAAPVLDAMADAAAGHPIILHAARLLEVDTGRLIAPGELLIQGERIAAVGSKVARPSGAEVIDFGDATLLPGLIAAHVHLFL